MAAAAVESADSGARDVVRVAFIVAVFGWGVGFYGPAVYLTELHQVHGWPISVISIAITAHYLLSAVMITWLPDAYRRFGVARVTMVGALSAAGGAIAWTNAQHVLQLVPALLLSGAGWSAMSGAALNAIVAPWFERDRPRAISMAFNGASIGGLLFAPLWTTLIAAIGLSSAGFVVSLATMVVVCPLAWRFLQRPSPSGDAKADLPLPRRAVIRQPGFTTLSAAFALGLFAQIGLFAHLIARLEPAVGVGAAALAVSLTTLCAVLGRSLLARLLGERDRRAAAATNFLVQAAGSLFLAFGSGVVPLALGCILFGLGVGNLISLPPLIAQREFRPADVGMVVALVTAINQAVFAFAPAAFGALRDVSGSYTLVFSGAAVVQVIAAAAVTGRRRFF